MLLVVSTILNFILIQRNGEMIDWHCERFKMQDKQLNQAHAEMGRYLKDLGEVIRLLENLRDRM